MNRPTNMVRADCDVIGKEVKNESNEHIGKIKEIVLEKVSGQVAYVVLDSSSFLGMGGKYFAIPWQALHYDPAKECFKMHIDKERLSNAPGFDKDHWPDASDRTFGKNIAEYHGTKPYWEP